MCATSRARLQIVFAMMMRTRPVVDTMEETVASMTLFVTLADAWIVSVTKLDNPNVAF